MGLRYRIVMLVIAFAFGLGTTANLSAQGQQVVVPAVVGQVAVLGVDMDCDACEAIVRQVLARTSGVLAVAVDLPQQRVEVSYDDGKTSIDQIVASLGRYGYTARLLNGAPHAGPRPAKM